MKVKINDNTSTKLKELAAVNTTYPFISNDCLEQVFVIQADTEKIDNSEHRTAGYNIGDEYSIVKIGLDCGDIQLIPNPSVVSENMNIREVMMQATSFTPYRESIRHIVALYGDKCDANEYLVITAKDGHDPVVIVGIDDINVYCVDFIGDMSGRPINEFCKNGIVHSSYEIISMPLDGFAQYQGKCNIEWLLK